MITFEHYVNIKKKRMLMEKRKYMAEFSAIKEHFTLPTFVLNLANFINPVHQVYAIKWVLTEGLRQSLIARREFAKHLSKRYGKEIPQNALFSEYAYKKLGILDKADEIDQLWLDNYEIDVIPLTTKVRKKEVAEQISAVSIRDINAHLIARGLEPFYFGTRKGIIEYIEAGHWRPHHQIHTADPFNKQGHDLWIEEGENGVYYADGKLVYCFGRDPVQISDNGKGKEREFRFSCGFQLPSADSEWNQYVNSSRHITDIVIRKAKEIVDKYKKQRKKITLNDLKREFEEESQEWELSDQALITLYHIIQSGNIKESEKEETLSIKEIAVPTRTSLKPNVEKYLKRSSEVIKLHVSRDDYLLIKAYVKQLLLYLIRFTEDENPLHPDGSGKRGSATLGPNSDYFSSSVHEKSRYTITGYNFQLDMTRLFQSQNIQRPEDLAKLEKVEPIVDTIMEKIFNDEKQTMLTQFSINRKARRGSYFKLNLSNALPSKKTRDRLYPGKKSKKSKKSNERSSATLSEAVFKAMKMDLKYGKLPQVVKVTLKNKQGEETEQKIDANNLAILHTYKIKPLEYPYEYIEELMATEKYPLSEQAKIYYKIVSPENLQSWTKAEESITPGQSLVITITDGTINYKAIGTKKEDNKVEWYIIVPKKGNPIEDIQEYLEQVLDEGGQAYYLDKHKLYIYVSGKGGNQLLTRRGDKWYLVPQIQAYTHNLKSHLLLSPMVVTTNTLAGHVHRIVRSVPETEECYKNFIKNIRDFADELVSMTIETGGTEQTIYLPKSIKDAVDILMNTVSKDKTEELITLGIEALHNVCFQSAFKYGVIDKIVIPDKLGTEGEKMKIKMELIESIKKNYNIVKDEGTDQAIVVDDKNKTVYVHPDLYEILMKNGYNWRVKHVKNYINQKLQEEERKSVKALNQIQKDDGTDPMQQIAEKPSTGDLEYELDLDDDDFGMDFTSEEDDDSDLALGFIQDEPSEHEPKLIPFRRTRASRSDVTKRKEIEQLPVDPHIKKQIPEEPEERYGKQPELKLYPTERPAIASTITGPVQEKPRYKPQPTVTPTQPAPKTIPQQEEPQPSSPAPFAQPQPQQPTEPVRAKRTQPFSQEPMKKKKEDDENDVWNNVWNSLDALDDIFGESTLINYHTWRLLKETGPYDPKVARRPDRTFNVWGHPPEGYVPQKSIDGDVLTTKIDPDGTRFLRHVRKRRKRKKKR